MSTIISTSQGSVSINDAAPVSSEIRSQGASATAAARRAISAASRADTAVASAKASFPLAPNLLADTKKFATLCDGRINRPMQVFEAHNGSAWSGYLYKGTKAKCKVQVVPLDSLSDKGIAFGGDLAKATNGPDGTPPWDGSDFRVVLFDVEITSDRTDGQTGEVRVLGQGTSRFTGWKKGEFATQTSCFVIVVEQTGAITFRPSNNFSAQLSAGRDLRGHGWKYLHATRRGWGGYHNEAGADITMRAFRARAP